MNGQREILANRVRELVKQSGRKPREISLAVTGKPDLVRDIFRGRRMPNADTLADLAVELETTTDHLLGRSDSALPVQSEVTFGPLRKPDRLSGENPDLPGIPLVGTGDCADLLLTGSTGEELHIERCSFDEDFHVTYIARPAALRGATDAYAIYFQGSSMEPRYFAGEVAIADPRRPASPGDFVIVQLTDGESDDVSSVLVKRLVRVSSREIELEQYNPALVFTLPKSRVKRMHRIVPPTEQLLL